MKLMYSHHVIVSSLFLKRAYLSEISKFYFIAILLLCFTNTAVSESHDVESLLQSFKDRGTTVYPLVGTRISSRFGMRTHPVIQEKRHHHGLDLAVPVEAPIRAIRTGRVVFADEFGAYGNLVVIQHEDDITSHYGHLHSIQVSPGEQVSTGQLIGAAGKTGRVTGPHLHLEIRHEGKPLDPLLLFPHIAHKGLG